MSDFVKVVETESDFQTMVQSGIVLVDFFATWCGPCRMQVPVLEEVGKKVQGKAVIAKVDTDKLPNLAAKFDVSSIPTLILFKDGQPIDHMVGLQQAAKLEAAIENAAKV